MSAAIIIASACIIAAVWFVLPAYRPKRPLPPGPPSANKAGEHPWKVYAAWSRTIGPLLTLGTSSRPVVVINTTEAVTDLLEKRSHFSCKPRWPMAELLGRQKNVGFQYYGERLKKSRKVLHNALNTNAIGTTWSALLNAQSLALLRAFFRSPETFYTDINGNVEALVVMFTYGKRPDAQYTAMAREVMHQTGIALQPGRWAVNFYPALMYVPAWFPGAGFQRWAQEAKAAFYRLTRDPFHEVKEQLSQGSAQLSFVRNALEASGQTPEEEDIIMSAAGSLFSAGTDTIATAILSAMLLLTVHPEVQARIYDDIKTVIGTDRLPEMHDRASLPYIDCVIQEILRFNPPIPLVTHANSEEDEYIGYRIPKKTWIMANVWAMLHDANDYPDPERFNPDRFLPTETGPERDPRTLIYGFGRRLCPGMHLANAYLFLVVAQTVAAFELLPPTNDFGDTKMPPLDFIIGLVSTPKPFRCILKPRAKAEELLRLHGED